MPIDRIGRHRDSGMDGDKTGNRERNVGKTWGTFIAKGIAIAVLYGIAYLALRYISFNQWFLPAGLRAACLLFMPYRYWLFIFLGDIAASLSQKIEMTEKYGDRWVYLSSLLRAPIFSIAPALIKMKFRSSFEAGKNLPLFVLIIALHSSLSTCLINYSLDGPKQPEDFLAFTRYLLGDFLGIMMVLLPLFFMKSIKRSKEHLTKITRNFAFTLLASISVYMALEFYPPEAEPIKLAMLISITLPALILPSLHGWKGSAAGFFMANLCIAQAMKYSGIPGYYDHVVYYAQIWLALISFFFFWLGSNFDEKQRMVMNLESLSSARMSLITNESFLRDQLICMAELQVLMDEERDELAKYLRANGKSREALELNNRGMEHRHLFELQALVLYPIGIERYGLFGVLDTPVFRESRASGTEVDFLFGRIDPRTLSNDLQVLAYRCLCHAIDTLSDWEPTHYRLQLRVWNGSERRGIYICATIQTAYDRHPTPFGESASLLLDARVRANGGILHRAEHRISLLLLEPNDLPAASTTGFSTG